MSQENEVQKPKKKISAAEFEKRVDIEIANLMRSEYQKKEEAKANAREYISSKFEIGEN